MAVIIPCAAPFSNVIEKQRSAVAAAKPCVEAGEEK